MPSLRQLSRTSSSTSVSSVLSPDGVDDDLHRPAVGQETQAARVALREPERIEQRVGRP